MLERPPTVVPANIAPVGTIACPRNCRPGGLAPSLGFAPALRTAATATVAATARKSLGTPRIASLRSFASDDGAATPNTNRPGSAPVAEPSEWARLDSNQGPTDYESAALTS